MKSQQYRHWTPQEEDALARAYAERPLSVPLGRWQAQYAARVGRTPEAVRLKIADLAARGKISTAVPQSRYPEYSDPLRHEGNALILPDVEAPFHHAEFIGRCVELARAWSIEAVIFAGDALHFDALSPFGPNWSPEPGGGLGAEAAQKILEAARRAGKRAAAAVEAAIDDIGLCPATDGIGEELAAAREAIMSISRGFKVCYYVLGNHEGRYLARLGSRVPPSEILRLLGVDEKRWKIAPYYYMVVVSGGEEYLIEHPKDSGRGASHRIAASHASNIIMGHNHHWMWQHDPSGRYEALEIGHCVDEARLPYAAQRHSGRPAHSLGACIIRDGFVWPLKPRMDWARLMRAK